MMRLRTMVLGLALDSVAQDLIQFWEHSENTLQVWRASSNFVYKFKHNDAMYFLRFTHEQERSIQQITAELDFMQYLHLHHYPTVMPILSKNGNLVEALHTSHGTYYAVVFNQAKGVSLDIQKVSEMQFEKWGKSLATLHHLSKTFKPLHLDTMRKSWKDALQSIESVLRDHPQETEAIDELKRIKKWLHTLPTTEENYGLIHYDFELDNIFWNERTAQFNVIDFDDSMYHWYVMDIILALRDLKELEKEKAEIYFQAFLRGYHSIMTLDESLIDQMPRFERVSNLYRFSRILHSLQDRNISNEPSWMDNLRSHLSRVRDELRVGFQQPW
ncbi:phosphotransferase enzyme family protein [Paenactinomyces guangxiensis]|uniref:Phosphotransferase n=1 Tax=Paenactinomyces guangxiensis TaxID=1490290 RepID=A0A7W2A8W8_9BACL|nr:phosphotransferase [Paenactinomyces guangxiensis]MBA4495050.1 phosphotransferase [Paenactinomyces guangxiensis]MBH8592266.1 phosphotransferase [Paenactinomyces guangxiensis]